jgi:hypothetical protein
MAKHLKERRKVKRRRFPITRTGSLAAAASLAAICQGYATPVYVPANDIILPGQVKQYDLDGDGDFEIKFSAILPDTFVIQGEMAGMEWNQIRVDTYLTGDLAKAYTAGAPIGVTLVPTLGNWGKLNEGSSGVFFDTPSPRFAGLYLCMSESNSVCNWHWGWAELNVTPNLELEVIAFGYEDVPGDSIAAGSPASVGGGGVSVEPTELLQNRPNPVTSQTEIGFQLPEPTRVMIRIFDPAGRIVRAIEPAETRKGFNSVNWNGHDEAGRRVACGVYFYRLEASGITQTRKMVVLE